MTTTTTNYTGRKVDLFIFQGAKPVGSHLISFAFGNPTKVTTGIQKLAQKYCMCFVTELGSVRARPDYGSIFVTTVKNRLIRRDEDVETYFSISNDQVRQYLRGDDTSEFADERFESAGLDPRYGDSNGFILNFEASKITLFIRLVSEGGGFTTLYLPISSVIV